MMRRIGVQLAALAMVAGAAACGPPRTVSTPPQQVIGEYTRALERGRLELAYRYMSRSFRDRYPLASFVRLVKSDPGWYRHMVQQLRNGAGEARLTAKVSYGKNESLNLVWEDGTWRISTDPTRIYGQESPRAALRSFVKAVERKRYDVVLRFVPERFAARMTAEKLKGRWEGDQKAEIEELVQKLRRRLEDPIHTSGDEASLPTGEQSEVRFVRENGLWKIQDAF